MADGSDELEALRAGDEAAFTRLVVAWSGPMLLLARGFVSTPASAEDVVQETWVAVVRGLGAFEGRSSLRTWVYRILVNIAKARGVAERRSLPFSSVGPDVDGPTLHPDRFQGAGEEYPGHWRSEPRAWRNVEDEALGAELGDLLRRAVEALPRRQRIVLTLRDVVGCGADEVCALLEVSAANQRVLLHRGRAAVRATMADYLAVDPGPDTRAAGQVR